MNGVERVLFPRKDIQSNIRNVRILLLFRQKLPSQYLQSYTKIWRSFTKWVQAQLEQDRIILVSDFSTIYSYFSATNSKAYHLKQLQINHCLSHRKILDKKQFINGG